MELSVDNLDYTDLRSEVVSIWIMILQCPYYSFSLFDAAQVTFLTSESLLDFQKQ